MKYSENIGIFLRYKNEIGQPKFCCYIKGFVEGMLKAIDDKIKKYEDGLLKYQNRLMEVESQIEIAPQEMEIEDISQYDEKKLKELSEEYAYDPENKGSLFDYFNLSLDLYEKEQNKIYEEIKSLKGRLWNTKLWVDIYTKHLQRARYEYEKIKRLEYFKNILTETEIKFISEIRPKEKEIEYYNEGINDGYESIFREKISHSLEKKRQMYPKAFMKWTKDEDNRLVNEFKGGVSIPELSKIFQRTQYAIFMRLRKLGLIKQ